jgi:hypothetical protein
MTPVRDGGAAAGGGGGRRNGGGVPSSCVREKAPASSDRCGGKGWGGFFLKKWQGKLLTVREGHFAILAASVGSDING